MLRGLKPWPILAGILLDTLGSLALGVGYVLVIITIQIVSGIPAGDSFVSNTHLAVIEVLGLCLVMLGGFVAARMAKTLHTRHGIAVGIGALVIGLLLEWVIPGQEMPAWYAIVSIVGVLPAGALGGYLAGPRANKPLQPTIGAGASN